MRVAQSTRIMRMCMVYGGYFAGFECIYIYVSIALNTFSNVVNQISQIKSFCEAVKQFICKIYVSSLPLLAVIIIFFVRLALPFAYPCLPPAACCLHLLTIRMCFLFLSVFRGLVQIKQTFFRSMVRLLLEFVLCFSFIVSE